MRIALLTLMSVVCAAMVQADTVFATRTLRPNTVIAATDLMMRPVAVPGGFTTMDDVQGLETRVAIYAGRPIQTGEVGPPALIQRNQLVVLAVRTGGLTIKTEGRALTRAGLGDRVRVMNLDSRLTVSGVVAPDGSVTVNP